MTQKAARSLQPGDTAPDFTARASNTPRFHFSSAAGRCLLLGFFATSSDGHAQAALNALMDRKDLFDDVRASFFGVSMDPADEAGRLESYIPGYRYFWDQDGAIGKLYGAVGPGHQAGASSAQVTRRWVLLDPLLRVVANIPFTPDRSDIPAILAAVEAASQPDRLRAEAPATPVLVLPRVLEPELCAELLRHYAEEQKAPSGFMVEEDGRTVLKNDTSRKRRTDCQIGQERLREIVRMRIVERILPQIQKAFQFSATRIERYMIGCYSEVDQGYFNPHRDNTTKGTAHRKFALTIALNDDYEGGTLRFPEFGPTKYKLPAGAAIVFSCSLLHTVDPVVRGERYVVVPFLYDEAAAKLRDKNRKFLDL